MIEHLNRQRLWSLTTFGGAFRVNGIVEHIKKELDEILKQPHDIEEWADLIILAFDGALRAGASPEEIIYAIKEKQLKNEKRKWPDYKNYGVDEAIQHTKNWPEGLFERGSVVRYGDGSTALMRVDNATRSQYGFRYYGRHILGGSCAAFHAQCTHATPDEVELYRSELSKGDDHGQ